MDKPKENPTLKQAHLQAAASPRSNQSLQKSLLFPPHRKNKKTPHLKKNKTLTTHNPTDKNVMTETIEKQNGMSLEKKEGQLVTACIVQLAVSASFKGFAFNKLYSGLSVSCFESPTDTIHANRYGQVKKQRRSAESLRADHPM